MVKKKDNNTEEKILAAAKKVFIKKGMAGARMQDIADEAGINKALLHYYFRNKEMLFEKIFTDLSQHFLPRLNLIFESDEPLFKKIELFSAAYIDKILADPHIPLFVLNEMSRRPELFINKVSRAGAPKPAKFVKQIESEIKAGSIRRVDPLQLIMNMVSLCLFPFIGKPMFKMVMNMDETGFRTMMEARKKEIPKFIIESLKK